MENSNYQFGHLLSRKEATKHFDSLFMQGNQDDPRFLDDFFIKVLREMEEKYQVCFKLFGEKNFKILVYEYMRNIPYSNEDYGHLFPEFLAQIPSLDKLKYIKWIAKLDWFWFADDKTTIQLPKGTLYTWGNLQRDEEQIDIRINENIMEKLVVKKSGKEFQIVSV